MGNHRFCIVRLSLFFSILLGIAGFAAGIQAQTLPAPGADDQLGLQPYQSYHGGDIDVIGLSSGTVSLEFPFLSYSQRGKLQFSFDLIYSNDPQHIGNFCPPLGGTCHMIWGYQPTNSPLPTTKGDVQVVWAQQNEVMGVNVPYVVDVFGVKTTYYYGNYSVVAADGAKHVLGNMGTLTKQADNTYTGSGPWRSLDASGWLVNGTLGPSPNNYGTEVEEPTSIMDSDGVNYQLQSGSTIIPEEDPNGNEITQTATGWEDSVGRSIPFPPTNASTSNTGTSECPQSSLAPLPVAFAYLWTVPAPESAGGTAAYTFCYATVTVNEPPVANGLYEGVLQETKLQSIVLPNGQSWNFIYNDPGDGSTYNNETINYGTLTQIGLPTGGTISYTYSYQGGLGSGLCSNGGRWVAKRIVNAEDALGPLTWDYTYSVVGGNPTTTVADPAGGSTVHTFGLTGSSCSNYETQTTYSGLKTVTTNYSYTNGSVNANGGLTNVVPTSVTTQWANGQSFAKTMSYDSGFTYTNYFGGASASGIYGKELSETDQDYGGGTLKKTVTSYLALSNSAYLTTNFLDLPSSVQIQDGGGNQKALTSYTYDGTSIVTSNISTQHVASPDGTKPANLTAVSRWITGGSYSTSNYTNYDTGMGSVAKDGNGNPTTYFYTNSFAGTYGAYPTTITNALGQQTIYTYDPYVGLVSSVTDPNQQPTSYSYEIMRRLSQANYPDGGETSISYQDSSNSDQLTQTMSPTESKITTHSFDGLGRIIHEDTISDPAGADSVDTTYDALGRVASISNPYRSSSDPTYGVTTYSYDALSRKTKTVYPPNGQTVTTTYTGPATEVQDEGNGSVSVTHVSQADGLGRMTSVCEVTSTALQYGSVTNPSPCGQAINLTGFLTSYTYDALGNMTLAAQTGLNHRSFAYDGLSRLTSATNPESGTISYIYDAAGNVLTRTAPMPNQTGSQTVTTTYTYDQLNRLLTRNYNDGKTWGDVFCYDNYPTPCPGGGNPASSYSVGRLYEADAAGRAVTWNSYDKMGRVASQTQCTPEDCGLGSFQLAYLYDYLGDMTSASNGMGVTISYLYDQGQHLSQVSSTLNDPQHPGTLFQPGLCTQQYDAAGQLECAMLGNGLTENYTYNQRLRLTQGNIFLGSTSEYSFSAGYANDGVVLSAGDTVNGNWTYTYDAFNRLATSSETNPTTVFNYQYDDLGNRWQQNRTAGSGPTWLWTFDTNNHLAAYATYDSAGNVIADSSNTYTYDAENRLISVYNQTAGTSTYAYDALGHRIQKTITSGPQYFLYDLAGHAVVRMDGNGNWIAGEVYAGGKHLATYGDSTTTFNHADWLGTERARTNVAGAVCENMLSLPFGDDFSTSGSCSDMSPLHFTAQYHDYESNLDYFGARYYDYQFGRFITPDAKTPSVKHLLNPQKWNRYVYVLDDPLALFDPDGQEELSVQLRAYIPQANVGPYVGDNRGPTVSQDVTSRTSITLRIETDPSVSANPLLSTPVSTAGQTQNILTGNTATQTVGLPTANVTRDSNGNVVINITQDAANPLTPAGLTPDIKSNLNLTIPTNASSVTTAGTVSGSPAFELNVMGEGGSQTNIPLQGAADNPVSFLLGLNGTNSILNSTVLPPKACGAPPCD